MESFLLKFYMREGDHHHGRPVWEWLMEQANMLGISGGSAFRAIAGFGRHHTLHEDRFVELAGTIAVAVEFVLTESQSTQLLELIQRENLRLPYVRSSVFFGMTGPVIRD